MNGGLGFYKIELRAAYCREYIAVVFIPYAKSPLGDRVVNSFSKTGAFSEYNYKTVRQKVSLPGIAQCTLFS